MGIFAPVAAPLARRAGLRNVVTACIGGVAVFGLVRAAVPGAPLLLLLTLPIGVGMAIAGALLPIAVKESFPDRPAFGNGVCTSGFNLGAATSSLIAVPTADAFGDWRAAFAVFSIAAVVQCLGWVLLSRGAWTTRPEWSVELMRTTVPAHRTG